VVPRSPNISFLQIPFSAGQLNAEIEKHFLTSPSSPRRS
jgi:hypothetical protein